MASTSETSVSKVFQKSIQDYTESLIPMILTPIIDFYKKEKGAEATMEELQNVLNIQNGKALVAPIVKSGTRRKTKADNTTTERPKDGEGCIYQYVRGRKSGKYCNNDCAEGSLYCRYCKQSARVKNGKVNAPVKSKTAKKSTTKGKDKTNVGLTVEQEVPNVNVVPLPFDNYYRQDDTGFIVMDTPEALQVVAKEEEDHTYRILTKAEQEEAKKYTLKVCETKKEAQEALKILEALIAKQKESEEEEEEIEEIKTTSQPKITQSKGKSTKVPKIPDVPEL
jgi:hypothetical protein